MFRRLRWALYRNRRRAGATCALFALFSLLTNLSNDAPLHIAHLAFVSLGTGVIMTGLLLACALIFPKWRAILEVSAATAALLAALKLAVPDVFATLPPTVHLVLVWGMCTALASLYVGARLDKYALRRGVRITARASSPLPPAEVWTGLYGLPEQRAALYNSDRILSYEAVTGRPHTYRLVERADDMTQIEELQEMKLRDAPRSLRFRWSVPAALPETPLSDGTLTADLTETARGGTRITTCHDVDVMPSRMALFAWVDDHFGRTLDDKLAKLETPSAAPLAFDPAAT